jgi:UDP-glucose 4-epimerase
LITGGTGLIGSYVTEKLLVAGESVVLFDLAPSRWRVDSLQERFGGRLQVVAGDVLAFDHLHDTAQHGAVRAIVHLAYSLGQESNASPAAATQVNVMGTLNVLEVARRLGLERLVLASSIAVYGSDAMYAPDQLPLREDAALHIASGVPVYGAGKVYLEKLGGHYRERFGLPIVGLRPSIVYGWGRRTGATGWITELIERPALGQPARVGSGDARVSLVYVEDVAAQVVALLRAPERCFSRFRFFNTGGETCTVREVAETVRRLVPNAVIEVTSAGEPDLAGLAATVSDRSLEEEVGYRREYTPLECGVRAHINIVRRQAGLPPI